MVRKWHIRCSHLAGFFLHLPALAPFLCLSLPCSDSKNSLFPVGFETGAWEESPLWVFSLSTHFPPSPSAPSQAPASVTAVPSAIPLRPSQLPPAAQRCRCQLLIPAPSVPRWLGENALSLLTLGCLAILAALSFYLCQSPLAFFHIPFISVS